MSTESADRADAAPSSLPLAISRVTADANLAGSLQRLALAGRDMLANCTSSSVTLIAARQPLTMAATDDVAVDLDRAQYEADVGPCLTAARQQQLIRIDDVTGDDRWPKFRDAARQHAVASSLSVPLLMEEPDTFGALNIYGAVTSGFSTDDEELAERFARHAAVVVANVVAYWTAIESGINLTAAMQHRGVIEQAKGILMATHHCGPDQAFALLRQRSQAENRKLRDIAIDLVADTTTGVA
jgi:GAF domain-containing protein